MLRLFLSILCYRFVSEAVRARLDYAQKRGSGEGAKPIITGFSTGFPIPLVRGLLIHKKQFSANYIQDAFWDFFRRGNFSQGRELLCNIVDKWSPSW